MELFTVTGKRKKFFLQLETFDVYPTGETANIDTIFKFLLHTRQHGCIDILHYWNDSLAVKDIDAPMLMRVWQKLEYRIDVCRVISLVVKKISFPVAVNNSMKVGPLVFLL
jgi:hypothetical protein